MRVRIKPIHLLILILILIHPVFASVEETQNHNIIDLSLPVVATVGGIDFRECDLSAHGRERKVQCAWFTVQENPKIEHGKEIDLFIVRLPAKRQSRKEQSPMLFIAGGPGQSASQSYLFADYIWSQLAKNRDFYLVDQRGTGYSNLMSCEGVIDDLEALSTDYDSAELRKLLGDCLQEMPGDVRYYTTHNTVLDFEAVRKALAIEKWNLLGVSYGTRVSTHYMRKYPDSLASVVLDSVVPPTHVLGGEIAFRSQNIVEVMVARCEHDAACAEAIPDLKADIDNVFAQLDASAVELKAEDFTSGEMKSYQFTRDDLTMLLRLYLYNPYSLAVLPPMFHEAAVNKNFAPLARASERVMQTMDGAISPGLHNSVMCTEEYPFYNFDNESMAKNAKSYMGTELIELMDEICGVWPKGGLEPDMKDVLESDVPTLLFSGEYDPITPPDYAEEAMAKLSNAKHFVLKGQGHFVSGTGCAPFLVDKFVADGGSEWLKEDCLKRLSAAPLYINFNGSAP